MKKRITAMLLAIVFVIAMFPNSFAASSEGAELAPSNLKINLLEDTYNVPLSSDPSFSWVFNDNDFNEVQTAYRLEIGRSATVFDTYTSGWVESSQAAISVSAGNFSSNSLYYWRVQTKDKDGNESAWSEPTAFVTALANQWDGTGESMNGMWITTQSAAQPSWTDYTVEQDITVTAVALGLCFRATNSTNYYMWQFRAADNLIRPHRANNGSLAAYGSDISLPGGTLAVGKTVRVKIQVSGSGNSTRVITWIDSSATHDGSNYVQVNDQTITGSHANLNVGRVGYRTGSTESGTVDNIIITDSESKVLYQNDFSTPFPNEFSGCSISGGILNVPTGQSNGSFWTTGINEKGNFLFARHSFNLSDTNNIEKAIVSGTAYMIESGTSADSLSYIYDLYMNGQSVGVGPARVHKYNMQGSTNINYYNSFDVTELLKSGENVIAASNYSRTGGGKSVLFQMTVFYKDGTKAVMVNSGRDMNQWLVKDGTAAFGDNSAFTNGSYMTQALEDMNGLYYPTGWNNVGYTEDDSWRTPTNKGTVIPASAGSLVPYTAENTLRFDAPAQSVTTVTGSTGRTFQVVDLGKEIVGGLQLTINNTTGSAFPLTVQCGESLIKTIDRTDTSATTHFNATNAPYGSVRYDGWRDNPAYSETWIIKPGLNVLPTMLMKNYRWVQFVDAPIQITPDMVTGLHVRQAFDDDASYIESDNTFLEELTELCKYSIKATNQDQYTDSYSRERRAYEGDLILNQYGSYAFSDNYALARHTGEYLMDWPTWPPEYRLFSIEMAWADYMYTSDKSSLEKYYDILDRKLPTNRGGTSAYSSPFNPKFNLCRDNNGAQSTGAIVDWPAAEQDGYRRSGATNATGALSSAEGSFTTVYNAVAYGAYCDMAKIAAEMGKTSDAALYQSYANKIKASLIEKLYDPADGGFFDSISGAGRSTHKAQHATAYALAYGIYDSQEMADKMVEFIRGFNNHDSNGYLRSSVYGTYFVLRGLYNAGAGDLANEIMLETDPSIVRSWAHMMYSQQATITTEAWSPSNKDNMTYSHPWGSTPGALITQGIFGIKPLEPGFDLFEIKFQPGSQVGKASIKSPSAKGPIYASFDQTGDSMKTNVTVPANSRARISLESDKMGSLIVNGEKKAADFDGQYLTVELGSGTYEITVGTETITDIQATIESSTIQFGPVADLLGIVGSDIAVKGVTIDNAVIALPIQDFTFVALNGKVSIANGVVKGLDEGNDIIKVTYKDGQSVEVPVTIIKPTITSLDFSCYGVYYVGETATLRAAGLTSTNATVSLGGYADLQWESSNTSVATITSDGLLTPMAAGTTTITAALISNPEIKYSTEIEIQPSMTSNPDLKKITGTVFGRTEGQWETGQPPVNAFDGRTNTYYDGQSGSYAGISTEDDFYTVTGIRYYPRSSYLDRMVGNYFQGSVDGVNWNTLYVITTTPTLAWQNAYVRLDGATPYQYFRIYSGDSGNTNVSEVEFYGTFVYSKAALRATYTEALEEDRDEALYLAAPWADYIEALDHAKYILDTANVTQDDIDDALKALNKAIANLVPTSLELADPSITEYEANQLFDVIVTTPSDATKVKIVNELGNSIGKLNEVVTQNDDGTKSYRITLMIGTPGDRTLSAMVMGQTGDYQDVKANLDVKIVKASPVQNTDDIIGAAAEVSEAVVNTPFTVTVVTSKDITKLKIVGETGSSIGTLGSSVVTNGNTKTWTISIKVGSKGNRTLTALGAGSTGGYGTDGKSFNITIK